MEKGCDMSMYCYLLAVHMIWQLWILSSRSNAE